MGRARPTAQAAKKARQGVRYAALEGLTVIDPETMKPCRRRRDHGRGDVPRQRRDEGLSQEQEGHRRGLRRRLVPFRRSRRDAPDGYIQLKDRSKDIIISGGENISSIEVEDALYKHPAVQACGVVAKARRQMGRDALRLRRAEARQDATEDEIIEHGAEHLARLQGAAAYS
jgi:fatty-acyl-CoA synthase